MKKLTNNEIYEALDKLRVKYKDLIKEFSKPKSLLDLFEDRYISALKSKMDLNVFLIAEIEALEQVYKNEVEKRKVSDKKLKEQKIKVEKNKTFADKVYEENKKKIMKYPRLGLCDGADEEVERLMGSIREFLLDYWPAVMHIYKDDMKTSGKKKFNEHYHNLITKYDYKEDVPFASHYVFALMKVPRDNKRVEAEHHFLIKETAFLLNEILEDFVEVMEHKYLPGPDGKLRVDETIGNYWYTKNFKDLTVGASFEKVADFLRNIIHDFRFKDIKRARPH